MADLIDCRALIEKYVDWLAQGFELGDDSEGRCRVITPYWRSDGDHIEFFALSDPSGKVVLTDEGQTFDWLFAVGIDVESEARQALLENLTERYNVTLSNGVLSIEVNTTEISSGLHRFLTALKAISQLTILRRQRGKPTFREEVELYLLEHDQKYETGFKIRGKTLEHTIDFFLDSQRNVLVQALTATSLASARSTVVRVAFQWLDIREGGWDYQRAVVVDDSDDKWNQIWSNERVNRPLETYSDRVLRWSTQRGELLGPLVAKE